MTSRQAEVLAFIKGYIDSHEVSPTYSEIAKAIGVSSSATVHKHLHCLKTEGRITLSYAKQSIRITNIPAAAGRFEFEGPHHLWDNKLNCYWVREKE